MVLAIDGHGALLLLLIIVLCPIVQVLAIRSRLFPDQEPTSEQLNHAYRTLNADSGFYYLRSAKLLADEQVDELFKEDDFRDPMGNFPRAKFEYSTTGWLRKIIMLIWYTSYEERTALHNYDEPRDLELARGPQFNQSLCGLHLDYMIHMNRRYNSHFYNSSELSISALMQIFDIPRHGLHKGNIIFLGDYATCTQQPLNIIRRELAQVNKSAADQYFEHNHRLQMEAKIREKDVILLKVTRFIRLYIGPFVGFPLEPAEVANLDKFSDQIKALPMRYCLAGLRYSSWPNGSYHERAMQLRSATCLPDSCDSSSLQEHEPKIRLLVESQMSIYLKEGLLLASLYCPPDERSPIRNPFNYLETTLFILFNVTWITLILLATLMSRRLIADSVGWTNLLTSWCLQKNIGDYLATTKNQPLESADKLVAKVNTAPLEGLKVFSSMVVIAAHACTVIFPKVWNLLLGHKLLSSGWLGLVLSLGPASVDVFFVITGIISAKILLSVPRHLITKPSFWVKFILFRYIRIVPLYLLVHWFLRSSFRFLGSGPLWDYGTSHTAWQKLCQQESWWNVILPQANLMSPAIHCNGVGWSLASDMQFTLLTPLIIILLAKRPLLGQATIWSLIAAVVLNHFDFFYHAPQDHRGAFENSLITLSRVLDDLTKGYVHPQFRCVAYLIGLSAGHILYLYSVDTIKKWPRKLVLYGKIYLYLIVYLLCVSPYLVNLLPLNNEPLIRFLSALRDGTFHTLISMAASIFILLATTGHLNSISKFFSLPLFKIISKASLCALLLHMPILIYHSQRLTTLPETSTYFLIVTIAISIVESYLLAAIVHVTHELPMRRLLFKLLLILFGGDDQQGKKLIKKQKVG